jgi:DNA repair exonuclease SbcCD ATPase subunit
LATYDAGEVRATMTADSSGLHGGVEAAKKDMQSLRDEAKKVKDTWRDMGLAAGVSFTAITAGVWKATQANNQLKASMMGLDSIAKGTIGTYSKIEAELEKVKNDGMIPLTNAIAAYKNLLMRYEDEETAIQMFHRLADAAAFGRQGHLSLGEAIQGATEGLKNEMSQMVDNAGVTKNLSVMHKEYAASIGKTVGQLTLAEKRQAEINGIMKETRHQVGDLAKLQNSLSGELAKANAETNQAAAAYGDALEPALSKAVGGYSALMKNIREFIQASPGMVAGITAGAAAMTGLVTVSSAWIALDMGAKIAAGFSALTGPIGLTMIALSSLAAVIIGVKTEMAKLDEERVKLADSYGKQAAEVEELITEYESLKSKTKLTTEEKKRLLEVSNRISEILPQAAKGYDAEGNAIIDVNRALKEMIILKGQEFKLREEAIRKEVAQSEKQLRAAEREIERLNKTWDLMKARWGVSDVNQIEDPLLRERAKELESEYNSELRKTTEEINRLTDTINFKKEQINYINDLLSGKITRETVKSNKPKPKKEDDDVTAITQKRINEQKELQNQLYIEMLERQKRFKEAEIAEEKLRYQEEIEIAKGNAELLEQVKLGHKERLAAIDRKYAEEEKQRNQALTDEIIRMTGTKEEQEELYIKRHAEQMERDGYNFQQIEDWKAAYHKQKLQEQADYQAGWIADIITRQRTLEDFWRQLMNNLVREYVQNFLLKIKAANATTGDTSFWGGLFSAIGSLFGGGAEAAAGAGVAAGATIPAASRGMIVPAAANGMVVPPSFGTDTVLSALTPKEMVLPPDISEGLQNLIRQGSQPQIVNNNITNNYIDAIDQQSVAQFFYKHRDQVVGIVQDNQRRGGTLRRSDDE